MIAIVLMFIVSILVSIGQFLFKYGINKFSNLLNIFVFLGIIVFTIGGIIMFISLKKGEVSVLYPINSTSFIWVSLISVFILKETMSFISWIGIFVIISGVSVINWGETK